MSLFDVLKYPISDRPTEAEFVALPNDLFINWVSKTGWNGAEFLPSFTTLSKVYSSYKFRAYMYEIKLLRKMIKEYEPI